MGSVRFLDVLLRPPATRTWGGGFPIFGWLLVSVSLRKFARTGTCPYGRGLVVGGGASVGLRYALLRSRTVARKCRAGASPPASGCLACPVLFPIRLFGVAPHLAFGVHPAPVGRFAGVSVAFFPHPPAGWLFSSLLPWGQHAATCQLATSAPGAAPGSDSSGFPNVCGYG